MEQKQELFGVENASQEPVFDHQKLDLIDQTLDERGKECQEGTVARLVNILRSLKEEAA
ncbi:MAG: hypothetical protein WCW56_03150 [Candidatus Paceibacterota bacterium]|jgi:hypothetical protein